MERDKKVEILVQEIRDQETETRSQLRSSTQNATLSIAIISAAGAFLAQYNVISLRVLPIFLTIAALSNANSTIDAAHSALIRDSLQKWANRELGGDVFRVERLAGVRRFALSGVAVNTLAILVLLSSWSLGLIVAYLPGQTYIWLQWAITGILAVATGIVAFDYSKVRGETKEGIKELSSRFKEE